MMFTKKEKVSGFVSIWAVPNMYAGQRLSGDSGPTEPPFRYELHTGHCWQTGAVQVKEFDLQLEIPEGINLIQKALDTLDAAKQNRWETYVRECKEIDEQKAKLMMLTYQASPTVEEDDGYIPANEVQVDPLSAQAGDDDEISF